MLWGNIAPVHASKLCKGIGGIAPHNLNPCCRWKQMVSLMCWSLYVQKKGAPGCWMKHRVSLDPLEKSKSLGPAEIRTPDRPDHRLITAVTAFPGSYDNMWSLRNSLFHDCSSLQMEATGFSETLANFYHTT